MRDAGEWLKAVHDANERSHSHVFESKRCDVKWKTFENGMEVTEAMTPLNVTVHDVSITNIDLPPELEDALQFTQIAEQEKEAALYEKETMEINALTKVRVAEVTIQRLAHEALRNAERALLGKTAAAIQTQYEYSLISCTNIVCGCAMNRPGLFTVC